MPIFRVHRRKHVLCIYRRGPPALRDAQQYSPVTENILAIYYLAIYYDVTNVDADPEGHFSFRWDVCVPVYHAALQFYRAANRFYEACESDYFTP
jgi:hypothetical protein